MFSLILIAYVAALIVLSLQLTDKASSRSAARFLTANATAGALLCALSLVSTIIGGSATLGMGSLAQKTGAAAFWWLGVGSLGLFIHARFIVPKIRALGACTLPDVLGRVVGRRAKRWSALIIVLSWVGVVAAQFTALRTLLTDILPGLEGEIFFLLVAGAVIVHTALGGQKAVIRTDALQTLLLAGGFTLAGLWCVSRAPAFEATELIPFNETFGLFDWIKLLLLVGITYVIGPDMFSRTFAARSTPDAQKGAVLAGVLLLFFGAAITFLALNNLSAANPISGWLTQVSPMPALIRIALALGLVGALAGSADTVLLSATGIVERDILEGDRSSRMRWLIALFGTGSVILAYESADIIGWLLYAYALFVPGVAVPLLVVLLSKNARCHEPIWLAGAVTGGFLGLAGNLTGAPLALLGIVLAAAATLLALARTSATATKKALRNTAEEP